MRRLMCVALVAVAGVALVGCGGSDDAVADAPPPAGISEEDLTIGREIVAGIAELQPVAAANEPDILEQYSAIGERRRQVARPLRDKGAEPCIADANSYWWLVVGGFALGDMTTDPDGRATLMLQAADSLVPAAEALNACSPELQAAIGWGG